MKTLMLSPSLVWCSAEEVVLPLFDEHFRRGLAHSRGAACDERR